MDINETKQDQKNWEVFLVREIKKWISTQDKILFWNKLMIVLLQKEVFFIF